MQEEIGRKLQTNPNIVSAGCNNTVFTNIMHFPMGPGKWNRLLVLFSFGENYPSYFKTIAFAF